VGRKNAPLTSGPPVDEEPIIDRVLTQSIPRDRLGAQRRTELLRARAATLQVLAGRGWRLIGSEGDGYFEGSPSYRIVDELIAPPRPNHAPRLYAVN
jgi:hypothetical protein